MRATAHFAIDADIYWPKLVVIRFSSKYRKDVIMMVGYRVGGAGSGCGSQLLVDKNIIRREWRPTDKDRAKKRGRGVGSGMPLKLTPNSALLVLRFLF